MKEHLRLIESLYECIRPNSTQRFVNHNKNKNQGNVKQHQTVNRPANTNHVPNKSEMKKLVVRLHNTVSNILKQQLNSKQINQTSKLRKPNNVVNKIEHKAAGNNQVLKISSSKPSINHVPSKQKNSIIHNQKQMVKQRFVPKSIDQSMFQTSFSTTRIKKKGILSIQYECILCLHCIYTLHLTKMKRFFYFTFYNLLFFKIKEMYCQCPIS